MTCPTAPLPSETAKPRLVPLLRPEVRIRRMVETTPTQFLLEDCVAGKCYEIGPREAHCLLACDGQRSIDEVLQSQPRLAGTAPLTFDDFQQLINWAAIKQLWVDHSEQAIDRQKWLYQSRERGALLRWTNPISFTIRGGSPERFLRLLTPTFGSLFDLRWLPWTALLGCYSLVCLWEHGDRFARDAALLWTEQQWGVLLVVWVGIKLIHEIAHGIVAHRYGVAVRDAGAFFVLFFPFAYVDVSGSARLPSRWKRIHIGLAGMYVELVLAAVATIAWAWTTNLTLALWLHTIVLTAGVSTLLFNANPLMKFDGYYVLSDFLGIANLADRGKTWIARFCQRWCLGMSVSPLPLPLPKRILVACYGSASLVWRLMLQVTLTIGAAALFHGLGIVIAILAIGHYAIEPLSKLQQFFSSQRPWESWKWLNVGTTAALSAIGIWLGTYVLTGPVSLSAPVVVRHPVEKIVRAGTDGFVAAVDVSHGQRVIAGQRLVLLSQPELQRQVSALKLQIEQAEIRAREARQASDWTEFDNQRSMVGALTEQWHRRQAEVRQLEVVAPCDGVVWQPDTAVLLGQYLPRGTALMTIDDGSQELVVSISQDDVADLRMDGETSVTLVFPNLPLLQGRLVELQPSASDVVPAPAMARTHGGPLLVQPVVHGSTDQRRVIRTRQLGDEATQNLRLVVPRVSGRVELPLDRDGAVALGQTGVAFLPIRQQSLASYLVWQTRRWLYGHLENLRQSRDK